MNIQEALEILHVSIDIKENEIKAKYKKLVMKYHPDKNNGDSRQFLKIKEAYDILLKQRIVPRNTIIINFNNYGFSTSQTTPTWSFNFG